MLRSAKLVSARTIEVVNVPKITDPKPGMAIVEVKVVGICGTDMHVFNGKRSDVELPRVMGHELSGVVTEVGEGVNNVHVGDRVVLDPVMSCRTCAVCKKGRRNVCADVKCFGVQMDGGLQDYIEVPADQLYQIPEKTTFQQAALAEPFSITANIIARSGLKSGETLVIIGAGTVGLCLIQAAKSMGVRVLATDVNDDKLAVAKEFGCDVVVNTSRESLEEKLEAFAPDGADVILDAVGVAKLFEQTVALAKPTTRVVVIGFDANTAAIAPVDITKRELTLIGSRMNSGRFPTVIEWFENSMIDPQKMISAVFSFEDIQKAFELATSDPSQRKILIDLTL